MHRQGRPVLHPVLAGLGTMSVLSVLFLAGLDSDEQSVPPNSELSAHKPQIQSRGINVLQDTEARLDIFRQQQGILRQEFDDRLQQLKQLTNDLKRAQTEVDSLKQQIGLLHQKLEEADANGRRNLNSASATAR
jgi:peptidoglycan hydrolase CwlO-like protein